MVNEYTKLNKTSVSILKRLKKGGKRVKNLYWDTGISWHNCRYHLTVLQEIGLVKAEKLIKDRATLWILTEKGHEALQFYE